MNNFVSTFCLNQTLLINKSLNHHINELTMADEKKENPAPNQINIELIRRDS